MTARLLILTPLLALVAAGSGVTTTVAAPSTEVVVTLASTPLGRACAGPERLSSCDRLRERLTSSQADLSRRIETTIPGAKVRWRYQIVANGLAVQLPSSELPRLARIPGVREVYPSSRYDKLASPPENVSLIGAPSLWGHDLEGAGEGVKIAIIDDGIDQTHPFFNPGGYAMPTGFPKGDAAFTTAKVIAARSFPSPGADYAQAKAPFDPKLSSHGTHVAGIAAGNADTRAEFGGETILLSGVAPRAYLGNYRAMTIPTEEFGLNGNSPEIVAAIEAAVSDGMNVINLSLGEPEIDPRNDIVVKAVNAAAAAGVVVVAAAGNESAENGEGSVGSPASAALAIAVGASTAKSSGSGPDRLAPFSSSGPTPFGPRLKPDVTAPGVDILSSVPEDSGLWDESTGTSMAAPHVAGAAALLRQSHPSWTVSQIKSALVLAAAPVRSRSGHEISPLRAGGGRIALEAADRPLILASPSSVSFGLLKRRGNNTRIIRVSSAGGGATASCTLAVDRSESVAGVSLRAPSSVSVPGSFSLVARASSKARAGNVDGWIVLSCAGEQRRIPFWLRVSIPRLAQKTFKSLERTGLYKGDTSKRSALVHEYRYPERASGVGSLPQGPEQVFRLKLERTVQNFGVVVVSHARGVRITPRIVRGTNESRLAGLTALPVNVNPYSESFGLTVPAAGALRPGPGSYAIVFDTPSREAAGRFRFRFWINDRTPPKVRLLSRSEDEILLRVSDLGSGVDPRSLTASIGFRRFQITFDPSTGKTKIDARSFGRGDGTLVFRAADYQEAKNNENAGNLLPNTSELRISLDG